MKIPEAKDVADKGWEKDKKKPAWQLTKVRSKKRGHLGGIERKQNSPFHFRVSDHLDIASSTIARAFGADKENLIAHIHRIALTDKRI